jgi:hypothetical protein
MRFLVALAAISLLCACTTSANQAGQDWQTEDLLEAMDGQTWVIGSHLITLARDAAVTGKPAIGSTLRVSGRRTDRGELLIDNVEVLRTAAANPGTPTPQPQTKKPVRTPVPPTRTRDGGEHDEGGD